MDLKRRNISEFPITDKKMTRFWMTTDQSVQLVMKAIAETVGGEIFVPRIPSMNVTDLAHAIEPKCTFRIIGIRAGEKMHEILISEDESSRAKIFDGIYVISPQFFETKKVHKKYERYKSLPANFAYRSDNNEKWLTVKELQKIITPLL